MKTLTFTVLASLVVCVSGCEEKPQTPKAPAPAAKPAAPAATGGMIEAAKEKAPTGSAIESATAEIRDKAVAALTTKYDEVKTQIATLQDKAKDVPAAAKAAFDSAMSQLNTLTKDVEGKLVELKKATGDAVKNLQAQIEGAWPKIQEHLSAAQKLLPGG